jgi:putative heme-binding domain-containing protein
MLALWSLEGLGALKVEDIEHALRDPFPYIREHGIRLAESHLKDSTQLLDQLLSLQTDTDPRVSFQLALTLGESNNAAATLALAHILRKLASDPWIRAAALSSATETADRLFAELVSDTEFAASKNGVQILFELAQTVGAQGRVDEVARVIEATRKKIDTLRNDSLTLIFGLGKGLKQSGSSLPDPKKLSPANSAFIKDMISSAESSALNHSLAIDERRRSIQILGCLEFEKSRDTFLQLLEPGEPTEIQITALNNLADYDNAEIAPLLVAGWQTYLPTVRTHVIRLLLSRDAWAKDYLNAVGNGLATAAEIEPTGRTQLLEHRDESIRLAAEKLFSSSTREAVIAEYRPVLQQPGDPTRGKLVYQRECSGCHRIGDQGYAVGPDLASSASRSPEALLTNALDPNRVVDPASLQYLIVDRSGRSFGGKIESETATSITLTSGRGVHDVILRSNIDEIVSTGKSLMPEGFEKNISKGEMADLIAYLSGLSSGIAAAPVEGTRPGSVEP